MRLCLHFGQSILHCVKDSEEGPKMLVSFLQTTAWMQREIFSNFQHYVGMTMLGGTIGNKSEEAMCKQSHNKWSPYMVAPRLLPPM